MSSKPSDYNCNPIRAMRIKDIQNVVDLSKSGWSGCEVERSRNKKKPTENKIEWIIINGMDVRPSGVAKRGRSRSNSPQQVSTF